MKASPADELQIRSDAHQLVSHDLEALGFDAAELFTGTGFESHSPASLSDLTRVYDRAVEESGNPWLGLRLGLARGAKWLGPLGEAIVHAPTVRAGIEISRRFVGLLVTGQRIDVSEHGDWFRISMSLPEGIHPRGGHVVLQSTTVIAMNVVEHVIGRADIPVRVRFACTCPPAHHVDPLSRAHRSFEFESERYGVEIPSIALGMGMRSQPQPRLRAVLDHLEGERSELARRGNMRDRVRLHVLSRLSQAPTLAETARTLGVAPRTLQLRLETLGTGFQAELRDVRWGVARRYLEDTDEPISIIAARLGFSATSVFSRHFHQLEGRSPGAFREGVRGR